MSIFIYVALIIDLLRCSCKTLSFSKKELQGSSLCLKSESKR